MAGDKPQFKYKNIQYVIIWSFSESFCKLVKHQRWQYLNQEYLASEKDFPSQLECNDVLFPFISERVGAVSRDVEPPASQDIGARECSFIEDIGRTELNST